MAGLLSVVAFDELWRVSKYLYYGVLASQNRGQDKYIAVLSDCRKLSIVEGDVSNLQLDGNVLLRCGGHIGAAIVLTSNDMRSERFTYLSSDGVDLALLVDGVVGAGLTELGKYVLRKLKSNYNLAEAFADAVKHYDGVYTLIAVSNVGEVVAYRSSPGLRPLHLGSYGFDMAILSSESAPINILGGESRRALTSGELLYVTPEIVKSTRVYDDRKLTVCSFEYIYLARHDSVLDGVDVYEFRKSLGARLARKFKYDVDVVVGVPDTAIPYAIGFSRTVGRDLELGFVATGQKFRTAIMDDPTERLIGIQLKLNPIRSVFSGRRVAVVDDSLVRGVTMKSVVQILRNRLGAKEVHVVIGSPKLMFGCPYGVDIPRRDELLAANLDDELSVKYLEADSLTWLDVDDVNEALVKYGVNPCLGCFLGTYPAGCVR